MAAGHTARRAPRHRGADRACAAGLRSPGTRSRLQRHRLGDEDADELRAMLAAEIANDELGELVYERDGRVVASFELVPVEKGSMHRGLAQPDGAALPRLCGEPAGRPRLGRRPCADRSGVCMGARAGVRDDGHRLARDEPPLLALLAGPRVPPLLPAALPLDPLAQLSAPSRDVLNTGSREFGLLVDEEGLARAVSAILKTRTATDFVLPHPGLKSVAACPSCAIPATLAQPDVVFPPFRDTLSHFPQNATSLARGTDDCHIGFRGTARPAKVPSWCR